MPMVFPHTITGLAPSLRPHSEEEEVVWKRYGSRSSGRSGGRWCQVLSQTRGIGAQEAMAWQKETSQPTNRLRHQAAYKRVRPRRRATWQPTRQKGHCRRWSWIERRRHGKSVGTLPQGHIRNVPLPRVPLQQSPTSQIHTIPDYYDLPYIVPAYATPHSIVENTAYAFSPAWQAIAINT